MPYARNAKLEQVRLLHAAISLVSGVETMATNWFVSVDTLNLFNPATPDRITVPAGFPGYSFMAFAEFAANNTGRRAIRILTNGGEALNNRITANAVVGDNTEIQISELVVNQPQTVSIFFQSTFLQNSGVNVSVLPLMQLILWR